VRVCVCVSVCVCVCVCVQAHVYWGGRSPSLVLTVYPSHGSHGRKYGQPLPDALF
jgi:hypothetical protein